MFSPSSRISPARRAPGISSFMRLIERRKVDFPQPDGPMSAVTARGAIVQVDVVQRLLLAVPEVEMLDVDAPAHLLLRRGGGELGGRGHPNRPVM